MLATDGEVKYRWGKQMLSLQRERNDCRGSFRFESNGVASRPSPRFLLFSNWFLQLREYVLFLVLLADGDEVPL